MRLTPVCNKFRKQTKMCLLFTFLYFRTTAFSVEINQASGADQAKIRQIKDTCEEEGSMDTCPTTKINNEDQHI